jgi:hypothetical protein
MLRALPRLLRGSYHASPSRLNGSIDEEKTRLIQQSSFRLVEKLPKHFLAELGKNLFGDYASTYSSFTGAVKPDAKSPAATR